MKQPERTDLVETAKEVKQHMNRLAVVLTKLQMAEGCNRNLAKDAYCAVWFLGNLDDSLNYHYPFSPERVGIDQQSPSSIVQNMVFTLATEDDEANPCDTLVGWAEKIVGINRPDRTPEERASLLACLPLAILDGPLNRQLLPAETELIDALARFIMAISDVQDAHANALAEPDKNRCGCDLCIDLGNAYSVTGLLEVLLDFHLKRPQA